MLFRSIFTVEGLDRTILVTRTFNGLLIDINHLRFRVFMNMTINSDAGLLVYNAMGVLFSGDGCYFNRRDGRVRVCIGTIDLEFMGEFRSFH